MGNGHHKRGSIPQPLHRGTLAQTPGRTPGPAGINPPQNTTGSSTASTATTAPAVLGPTIVRFARDHVGQQVGDGECYALADQALRGAGAASAPDFGVIHPDSDYQWSSTRVQPADAQTGDVIQFRNYSTTVRVTHANGAWHEQPENRPHHTAVVVSNDGNGNLTILEQNVRIGGTGGQAQRTVRQNVLHTAGGTTQSGGDTVTTTISGTIVIYRPVAASAAHTQPAAHAGHR